MITLFQRPYVVLVLTLFALWIAVQLGAIVRRLKPPAEEERRDLELIVSSSLTLLALIIGFSFSMAVNRYDQRKNYEAEEANAIGTEYVRAGLLMPNDAATIRNSLKQYLQERILFYRERDPQRLAQIEAESGRLEEQMWATVEHAAAKQPTPPIALAVSGMNDVLNQQGYTQSAWLNRIPAGAWTLMVLLAIGCSLLIGYAAQRKGGLLFTTFPVMIAIAFFLIADIDSPRRGIIRVIPQDLIHLSQTLGK